MKKTYTDPYDIMSEQELFTAWQMALEEIRDMPKLPFEKEHHYITRCWLRGIIRSLKKSGYEICLKKEDLEIGL